MEEHIICKRCVMDNASDKSITFDDHGFCNYCNDVLIRMPQEYFPNEQGKSKLDELMEKIKKEGVGKKYDCLVGVSGGVDSSYILYLGYKYNLRMLAVHIDDGFDTEKAKNNIYKLCSKINVELFNVVPDKEQYANLLLSFFKAAVPNLAMPQDNILTKELYKYAKNNNIKYSLSGANFSQESILERFENVNASDKKHIISIHKQFGSGKLDKLHLNSVMGYYLFQNYSGVIKIKPLNFIDYNLQVALKELNDFAGYEYYGGKHFESILTRFLQCYYLPVRYNFDKRKSYFSSLILSGQMTREEALTQLSHKPYPTDELKQHDLNYIATYLGISMSEFDSLLKLPPKRHSDYPHSLLNSFSPIARKFRKYLG